MTKMKSINYNEAITRLPVLLLASKDCGNGWVATPEHKQLHGEKLKVLKRLPVREIPAAALAQFAEPATRATFEAAYGRIPKDFSQQLFSMLGIADAIGKNDLNKVAKLAKGAAPEGLPASWAKLSAVILPWDTVAATLNTGLFGAMPVLWQKGLLLAPALLCRTPAQALFAHALFEVSGRHGLGVCRRCRNPFFASRERGQLYCGYKCRTAEAMKRYRANVKLKESRS